MRTFDSHCVNKQKWSAGDLVVPSEGALRTIAVYLHTLEKDVPGMIMSFRQFITSHPNPGVVTVMDVLYKGRIVKARNPLEWSLIEKSDA